MAHGLAFTGVFPIGDTDVHNLPVKTIGPAIGYYTRVLGFAVVEKTDRAATLRRGGAQIGLAVNGKDPDQASCYFAVTDVAGTVSTSIAASKLGIGAATNQRMSSTTSAERGGVPSPN